MDGSAVSSSNLSSTQTAISDQFRERYVYVVYSFFLVEQTKTKTN
jgi:hypothetical protein